MDDNKTKSDTKLKVVRGGKRKNDADSLRDIRKSDNTPLNPFYENRREGLFYTGIGVGRDGTRYFLPPLHVSDYIEVIGHGLGDDGKEYRIIQYRDRYGETLQAVVPMEIVGMPPCLTYLRGLGINIRAGAKPNNALADYLQFESDKTQWRVALRGGWIDESYQAYVLPSGEIIGNTSGKVIYNGDTSNKKAYAQSGSLEDWQQNIARYSVGNSRLLLALGIAFAAPLLSPMKLENGGFHLFQSSSGGKTTTALVALSVYGNPEKLKHTWRATAVGIDNAAAATSDGFMVLDEISQARSADVSTVAYSLFNGVGKMQGAKTGGNKERMDWRVLLLSTGEFDVKHYMQLGGFEWNAGQNVRLPSIPADAGKGFHVFDTLHDYTNGAQFAEMLEWAAKNYYGNAGRVFIRRIIGHIGDLGKVAFVETVRGGVCNAFMDKMPKDLSGQPARVAKRFALVAAALELAGTYGITGFSAGVGIDGVLRCFNDWCAYNGRGNYEERMVLERLENFIQTKGNSEEFRKMESIGTDGAHSTSRYHCGYREQKTVGYRIETTYWITAKAFEENICIGYDKKFVCEVLTKEGLLQKSKDRYTRNLKRTGCDVGRYYVIKYSVNTNETGESDD